MRVIGRIPPSSAERSSHEARHRLHVRRLKAVAVLPALATLGNLICGLGAIYMCLLSSQAGGSDLSIQTLNSLRMERWFPTYLAIGAYLVFLAAMFDGIDGRLARLSRKTSEFGAQLDSMADIVSFGVAPALLALTVARPLLPIPMLTEPARLWWRVEWVMIAGYVCCAALRLARFNVENVEDEAAHRTFKGLPSPGAAATVIGLVILHEDIIRAYGVDWASTVLSRAMPLLALMAGLLMVSRLRYVHLVNYLLKGRRPFSHVVVLLFATLVGAVVKPQLTIAILGVAYAISGPAGWLRARLHHPAERAVSPAQGVPSSTSEDKVAG